MARDASETDSTTSLYDVLQVSPTASQEVIHAAYRALARACHPDVNPSAAAAERMQRLNAAYSILGDSQRRARYDLRLTRSSRTVARPAPAGVPPVATDVRRGRPRPSSPRRVEEERAAAAQAARSSWTPAHPRIVMLFAVLLILVVATSLAVWLASALVEDVPGLPAGARVAIASNVHGVSRVFSLALS